MNEPTFSELEVGKVYDIQTFDGIGGRIGKVLEKEKTKKGQAPGSLQIEFHRPPVAMIKGVEVKVSPTYRVWVKGDYPIAKYTEVTRHDESNKPIASIQKVDEEESL